MTDVHGGVSFAVDERSSLVLDSLAEFVEREVEPLEDDLGDALTNPREGHQPDGRLEPAVLDAIETVRKRSAAAGFYAMNLPVEAEPATGDDGGIGGASDVDGAAGDQGAPGVDTVTWYRAKRLVASYGRGLAEYALAGPEGPKPLLLQAEGAQRERYLRPCVRGERSTAFALTEPGAGSDAPNMATTADRVDDADVPGDDPDAEWILDGRKQWITNAPYADFAQVFARTTPQDEAGRYGGITCFLVEADEYEVGRLNNAVGLEGMQAELVFDGVAVPGDRVLGDVDAAFYAMMEFLGLGRLELGATAVGHAQYLLDRAEEYAIDREAFGRPIGTFQGVSHKVAAGRARVAAADAQGLRSAWLLDREDPAIEETSAFKWFATNVFFDVADDVVQVHGANGVAEENEFVDHLELARVLRIVEGTDEIQLNTIASERGLL
jgi:acyl-CoA dehydrogenase